jgi:hypothetical protein
MYPENSFIYAIKWGITICSFKIEFKTKNNISNNVNKQIRCSIIEWILVVLFT